MRLGGSQHRNAKRQLTVLGMPVAQLPQRFKGPTNSMTCASCSFPFNIIQVFHILSSAGALHANMNIGGKSTNDILFINYNQDFRWASDISDGFVRGTRSHIPFIASCVSVGTRQGYKIYNCDPFGKCYGKGIHLVC